MNAIIIVLGLVPFWQTVCSQEQAEHRNFQYNSAVDPLTGRYNFAYDTGNDNDIAHSMHMQYQDADGIVRGRYGYTDPRGKLRMVEYEAGPNGFVARGDVGPDMSLHDNAPVVNPDSSSALSSYKEGDFLLDPAPVQMAGWDPERNPLYQGDDSSQSTGTVSRETEEDVDRSYLSPFDRSLFPPANDTSNSPVTFYNVDSEDQRISYSGEETTDNSREENEVGRKETEDIQNNTPLNVDNIDISPDEIRAASESSGPVRRSADDGIETSSTLQDQQVRSQSVKVTTPDGRRLFYRDSHSMEPHEHYYQNSHDHDSEVRYYRPRQTHDHDAERRYYRPRQTHDHDAEKNYYIYYDSRTGRRYYRPRATHDHDAEKNYYVYYDSNTGRRYYRPRATHDHDAESRYYKTDLTHYNDDEPSYYKRIYRNGRALYRDRHSYTFHAHTSEPYQNHQDHQHSDVHLYANYRNSDYPATAKPRQLQYIPSDKYHDKKYYWTYS